MTFKNDGSVHHSGVEAEHNFIGRIFDVESQKPKPHGWILLPNLKGIDYLVSHKGGTRNKSDCIIESLDGAVLHNVSNKKKESLTTGSWDWVNTSSIVRENSDWFADVIEVVETFNRSGRSKKEVEAKFKKASNKNLRQMTSNRIKHILQKSVIDKNQHITMVVSDLKNCVDYSWPFTDHPLNDFIDTHTPVLEGEFLNDDYTTSARIIFVKGQNRVDLGLRLRIVTNNGITALVGTEKSSQAVVKIQQDKCDTLLERVQKKGNLIAKPF